MNQHHIGRRRKQQGASSMPRLSSWLLLTFRTQTLGLPMKAIGRGWQLTIVAVLVELFLQACTCSLRLAISCCMWAISSSRCAGCSCKRLFSSRRETTSSSAVMSLMYSVLACQASLLVLVNSYSLILFSCNNLLFITSRRDFLSAKYGSRLSPERNIPPR
jgi:hypothetical protein